MSPRTNRCRILAMAGLAAAVGATSNLVCAQIPCEYEVTTLRFPIDCGLGTVITTGLSLNENGAVVGTYRCPLWTNFQGFLWTAEGGFEALDPPQGVAEVFPTDINNNGIICGTVLVSGVGNRGFVYDNGEWTILPPVVDVPGARSSAAAINNTGTVVGQRSLTKDPTPENAYIWSPDKGFTDLGVMNGGASRATDLTERGDVVGSTGGLASPGQEAFLWQDGELTLLGYIPQGISSSAKAVSTNGSIAGGGLMDPDQRPDILGQPALWQDGEWRLLGLVPGCDAGGSRGINDQTLVVGGCGSFRNPTFARAFVWGLEGIFDINDLVSPDQSVVIKRAFSINMVGQIIADGDHRTMDSVTFLLTPVEGPLGDLNDDCQVGAIDLLILLVSWGETNSPADLNRDGIVDHLDLMILLDNWG